MRKKIGELLVEAGIVTEADVSAALEEQTASGTADRLGEVLISMGKATAVDVARALAKQFNFPFVEIPEIPSVVSSMVALEFQAQHRIVPFRLGLEGKLERVFVAVADPTRLEIA